VVSVKTKSQQLPGIQEALSDSQNISYLSLDRNMATIRVNDVPARDFIPVICDVPLVIEYYSR
jgi:hypothetical protein